jgi:predicted dithiol-disulfide oxidoreductase (DUF899 family)
MLATPCITLGGAFARCIDLMNTAYNYLDVLPKGRNEGNHGPFWVRRHDEYEG